MKNTLYLKIPFTLLLLLTVGFCVSQSDQQYKRTDYDYDLVSGNVKAVHYQNGEADQLHHAYEYDADNRITEVYSSTDNVIWDKDASYFYYKHGPLARTELGDQKVQAQDYAYTLQGWIKGVNSNTLEGSRDLGKDGTLGTDYTGLAADIHSKIAKDASGYSLSYYDKVTGSSISNNSADYEAIESNSNNFIADASVSPASASSSNLFNGNIKAMVTTITDLEPLSPTKGEALPQLTAYRYDQLNRITSLKAYRDLMDNTWLDGSTYDGAYESTMTYDANGNILTLNRNDHGVNTAMDQMTYQYDWIDEGDHSKGKRSNKLYHVNDVVPVASYSVDIDDQGAFTPATASDLEKVNTDNNYGYDEIGNLIRDNQEEIANISWTVYGKIKSITRITGSEKSDLEFAYDATGNRISKTEKIKNSSGDLLPATDWITTYYSRDASGNTMATYKKEKVGTEVNVLLQEQNLFGSSRLGIISRDLNLTNPLVASANVYTRTLGKKRFELANHLGNVLSVVTDRKLPIEKRGIYFNDFTSNYDPLDFELATLSIEGGRLKVDASGSTGGPNMVLATVAGHNYRVSAEVDLNASGLVFVMANDYLSGAYIGGASISANGTFIFNFTASSAQTKVFYKSNVSPARTFYLDDLLIEDLSVTSPAVISFYKAEILSATDYYAFGSPMPGRNFTGSDGYRYGFGSKEKDDEIKGAGNSLDYGARIYDPRLGRWLAVDPLAIKYPAFSTYSFVNNSPIIAIDPDGKKIIFVNGHYQDNFAGDLFNIGRKSGKDYWSDGFIGGARNFFNDDGARQFVDGSSKFGGDMDGADRYEAGYAWAKANYETLIVDLKEGEVFNMVTSSEGAAHGAGIAAYLIEQGKTVKTIVHLSPDEGDDFSTPQEADTYQLNFEGDWITGNEEVEGVDKTGTVEDNGGSPHARHRSSSVWDNVKDLKSAKVQQNLDENGQGYNTVQEGTAPKGTKFSKIDGQKIKN